MDVYVLDAEEQPARRCWPPSSSGSAPAECLVAEGGAVPTPLPGHITMLPPSASMRWRPTERVRRLYGVSALDGFGLALESPALAALGALVGYVGVATIVCWPLCVSRAPYVVGSHVALDPMTRRNLELTRTVRHGQARGSLCHAIDRTRTPMGARRLRRVLGQPLVDRRRSRAAGRRRSAGAGRPRSVAASGLLLGRLGDVERLIGRVRQETATPREALMLANALRALPSIAETSLAGASGRRWRPTSTRIDGCPALVEPIEQTLAEPAVHVPIRAGPQHRA